MPRTPTSFGFIAMAFATAYDRVLRRLQRLLRRCPVACAAGRKHADQTDDHEDANIATHGSTSGSGRARGSDARTAWSVGSGNPELLADPNHVRVLQNVSIRSKIFG